MALKKATVYDLTVYRSAKQELVVLEGSSFAGWIGAAGGSSMAQASDMVMAWQSNGKWILVRCLWRYGSRSSRRARQRTTRRRRSTALGRRRSSTRSARPSVSSSLGRCRSRAASSSLGAKSGLNPLRPTAIRRPRRSSCTTIMVRVRSSSPSLHPPTRLPPQVRARATPSRSAVTPSQDTLEPHAAPLRPRLPSSRRLAPAQQQPLPLRPLRLSRPPSLQHRHPRLSMQLRRPLLALLL